MFHRLCCSVVTIVAFGLTTPPVDGSETEVLIRYDSYCTVGFIRSCASVRLHSLTTGEGTSLSIYLQNLQGTNPVDNTDGSIFRGVGGSGGFVPQLEVETWPLVEPVGTVGGSGPLKGWSFVGGNHLGVEFLDEAYVPILGCDRPWEDGDALEVFRMRETYFQTCPRTGLDGWAVVELKHPEQFTALDVTNFGWTLLSGNDDEGWHYTHCRPTDPDSCVHTVPEPNSFLLLIAGLSGMGLAGLGRRRGTQEISPES